MFTRIALLLALAAAPALAQGVHAPAAPNENAQAAHQAVEAVNPHAGPAEHGAQGAAAGTEHGAEAGHESKEEGVDFLHHILDSREVEAPWGSHHMPARGSLMVGGIDMTPTKHVLFLGFAALLTLGTLLMAAASARRAPQGRSGGRRHNAIEAMVLYVRDQVVMPNIGHGGEKYAPYIVTLFFFILFNNLLGILPYGATATANISVTAGLALISFVVIEVSGMVALGPAGYLGTIFYRPHGMSPAAGWAMAIALSPVELIGKITKPISLSIRLMANMTAGHIVILALISLIFVFGSYYVAVAPVLMATAIYFLEIFVAFLQAFIFAMLTSVFVGLIRHAH